MPRFLTKLSWRTAVILLVIAALCVPLIVGSGFFFPYVVPRNLFFRVVVEVGVTALVLALCFGGKTLDLRDEPIFWSLAAFLAAAALSAVFSPARYHSFFGDFERMGGVWAWLHLFLFFLLLRTLRDKDWGWILNAALAVSLFVSVTAIGQHTAQASSSSTPGPSVSTLGNSGLLAAYLLMTIAIAAYLAAANVRYRLLYVSAGAVNVLALIYAENRSTILGLALGGFAGTLIFALVGTRSRRKWIAPGIAAAAAFITFGATAAMRAFPESGLALRLPTVLQRVAATNFAGSDESRTMQWRAAIEGFKDRPFTGYGLENHNLVWSAHFDPGIYRIDTDVYDRTHNQFLEILATTGLVGTIAFLGIWVAIGVTLARAYRAGRVSPPSLAVLAAVQIAYIVYLTFWFVDINSTMLWIMLAALIASRGTVGSVVLEAAERDTVITLRRPGLAFVTAAVLMILLYAEGLTPLRANRALARIDSPTGSVSQTLSEFDVLADDEGRQTAHTPLLMAQYVGSLRSRLDDSKEPQQRQAIHRAFADAVVVFDREIERDSLNDRLYTYEGQLYADAARLYGSPAYRQKAIDAFHKAIDLSPRRIEPRLALARLYTEDRDYERAAVVLSDAVKVDPQLGEPRYRLAEAYIGAGQSDSALAMLQSSLKLGYVGAPGIYLSMGKRLEFSGRNTTAANLYSTYLEAKYTDAVWDPAGSIDRPIPSADIAVAAHLPLLYMRTRESELAIKSAAALSAFDPSRSTIVDRFVSDVGSRRRAGWLAKNSLLPCKSARPPKGRDSIPLDACGVFRGKL